MKDGSNVPVVSVVPSLRSIASLQRISKYASAHRFLARSTTGPGHWLERAERICVMFDSPSIRPVPYWNL